MKLDRKGIPEKVLTGKVRKYISVHRAYKAYLIQEIMKRLNASFWARAKRGADDMGNTWKPLSPKTHAYKPLSPIEKNTYAIDGRRTRGLLTPAQDRIWRGVYARTLARLIKRGVDKKEAEKEAAEKAWGLVKAKGARTLISLNRITDTNIRTGRLVNATRPGSVANNRYYPPRDQVVQVKPRSVRISFNIPYIGNVDAVRPVVPRDISKWHQEAHEIAIIEARLVYDRIRDNDNRKRQDKKSTTKRNKTRRNRNPPRR